MDFELGPHFDQFKVNMLKTVPPTRQFSDQGSKQVYKHSFFILCFVADFDAIFDSVTALKAGQTDLSNTLLYKLLTVCGTYLSNNHGKKKQVCWVEQTRSVQVTQDEKEQLVSVMP